MWSQWRHLHIYPPSLTFAQTWTLKKSMVSVKELSFPTLGIICWRWCSDLWVFDGFCGVNHDPPHTAASDGCHNHQLVILRSPDGFCNLCNSPKGEEDDAQKNEQHLSAGFFFGQQFLGNTSLAEEDAARPFAKQKNRSNKI